MENYYNPYNIPMYRDGVLWLKKRGEKVPVYIIKLVRVHKASWAFVYEVDIRAARQGEVKKRTRTVLYKDLKAHSNSELASILNEDSTGKDVKVTQENPYIYQSLVVGGVSSITGKEGEGFYEYANDTPTKVFIGLDDVTWENELAYNPDDLVKEVLRSIEEEQILDATIEDF